MENLEGKEIIEQSKEVKQKAPAKKKPAAKKTTSQTTKKTTSQAKKTTPKKKVETEVLVETVVEMKAMEKKEQAEIVKQEEVKEEIITVEEKVTEPNTPYVFTRIENVDVTQGLSSYEVENRIRLHYNNENNIKTTKTGWQIVRGNVFTFFNMLYIVITVLLVMAKSWANLTFLAVIIPNTVLGIFQEFKAKKIIEKLNLVTAPHAIVVRDGEKKEIDTKEVVLDDIIRFATGNQISADSIVKSGFVEVN